MYVLIYSAKAAAAALYKITGSNAAAVEYLETIIASGNADGGQQEAASRVLKALTTSGKNAFMETDRGGEGGPGRGERK